MKGDAMRRFARWSGARRAPISCGTCKDQRVKKMVAQYAAARAEGSCQRTHEELHAFLRSAYGYKLSLASLRSHLRVCVGGT